MIDGGHVKPEAHPTDAELVAWLDDPEASASGTGAGVRLEWARHFEACDDCQARLERLDRLWAALRDEPSAPPDEALAAQRESIMTEIEARPRHSAVSTAQATESASSPAVRPIRRWWWVPLAAAAAAVALLLLAPDRSVPPPSIGPDPAGQTLPVVAGAEEAAEETFRAVVDLDPAAADEAALASLDAAPPILTDEGSALEEEFAALPIDDQEAILDELSTMTFEL